MKYYCNCWHCTRAKTKRAIAREKEKRLFRCGGGDTLKTAVATNTSIRDGI